MDGFRCGRLWVISLLTSHIGEITTHISEVSGRVKQRVVEQYVLDTSAMSTVDSLGKVFGMMKLGVAHELGSKRDLEM